MEPAIFAAVLAAASVLLVSHTAVWLLCSNCRNPLEDFDESQLKKWLPYSLVPAVVASAIALVALPVYAYKTADTWFFVGSLIFYFFEILWLPVTTLKSLVLNTAVLFCAALGYTLAFTAGVVYYHGNNSEQHALIAVLIFPLCNVWINDLIFYSYQYYGDKKRQKTFRKRRTSAGSQFIF